MICIAREFLNRNRFITLSIMFGGLLTFSTAHLFVATIFFAYILHRLYSQKSLALFKLATGLAFPVIFITASVAFYENYLQQSDSLFLSRIDADRGIVTGNNRYNQTEDFVANIDWAGIVFGHPMCAIDRHLPTCLPFGDQTSNIFSPIFHNGLIGSLPFYLLILTVLGLILSERFIPWRYLFVIFIAVLMQRPYAYSAPMVLVSLSALQFYPRRGPVLQILTAQSQQRPQSVSRVPRLPT